VPEPDNCCATKPNQLADWWMSASGQHCDEPHVDTVNPAGGTQHMRFSRSDLGGSPAGCVSHDTFCRVNAFSQSQNTAANNPNFPGALPPGITTVSFDVARSLAPGSVGVSLTYFSVAEANATGQEVDSDAFGYMSAYDLVLGSYAYLGAMAGNEVYDHVEMIYNRCNGTDQYYWNGTLMYSGQGATRAGAIGIERHIFQTNNAVDGDIDIDNFFVNRVAPCPQTCGDGVIEGTEECEPAPPGDACCPGLCGAAGTPDECICARSNDLGDCAPRALVNGENGPFLTDGGLYSYLADAPFTSVDTCGSDYDTELYWNINPQCTTYSVYNDECIDSTFGGIQAAGDPNASCYTPGGCTAQIPCPTSSCQCNPTTPGLTYTFLVGTYPSTFVPAACTNTVVHITKKTSCNLGGPIPGGACCNTLTGTCTDGLEAPACAGPFDVYSDNKLCSMVPCEAITGACCNTAPGSGGACTVTTQANCPESQYQTWTPNGDCTAPCDEVTGSCCDGLSGSCTITIQGACSCAQCSWTEGGACPGNCVAATGACCVDDGLATANCTDGVTLAACAGTWTQGVACANLPDPCQPDFVAIPTVSEWGLAVLALMLLIGGKIYFSRRDAATA
jgi:hypothetical protein